MEVGSLDLRKNFFESFQSLRSSNFIGFCGIFTLTCSKKTVSCTLVNYGFISCAIVFHRSFTENYGSVYSIVISSVKTIDWHADILVSSSFLWTGSIANNCSRYIGCFSGKLKGLTSTPTKTNDYCLSIRCRDLLGKFYGGIQGSMDLFWIQAVNPCTSSI